MEAIKVQDLAINDLLWKIEYNAERCTMCGSYVASCTFRAIKVEVQRKSITISEANQPEPIHRQCAIPVIKQVADINCACRGCGMCERVCPNNAIRAVRNTDRPLWHPDGRTLRFRVTNAGQRIGSMYLPNTEIIVEGSTSADVGWLNSGGLITVKGDAGDTAGHYSSGGKIYIGGRAIVIIEEIFMLF